MPFICLIRTDIDPGLLQDIELRPNTSQRSLIYDPPPQSGYISFRPQNDTVVLTGAGPINTVGDLNGLAAYLVDRVENTGGGAIALTSAEANAIAAALIARMDAGSTLALADINTEINVPAGVSGSDLDGTLGNSTGTVDDVLSILSGNQYTVPSGTEVETVGNAFVATISGAFGDPRVRRKYPTGALNISLGEGRLAAMKAATFTYAGTAGAAIVVYDDAGAVL